ncbi:hypothetical protein IEQ34_018498 [Dendrobium chrysotoxum]|uniref:Uncharacterized protein n=1 Tax=Dendrobium chrysotoxum TaxID=161865 RepID=A0AAV7FNP4_DENCH|nr:hypothetical protein IEQ34_018498 [Dendrobium chrysotoxum]
MFVDFLHPDFLQPEYIISFSSKGISDSLYTSCDNRFRLGRFNLTGQPSINGHDSNRSRHCSFRETEEGRTRRTSRESKVSFIFPFLANDFLLG